MGQEPLSNGAFRTFIGSTDEAVRPRTSRNFKISRPVKGRAGLEPRLPDSQARTSHSPVLFSRFFQTKDIRNLLSPSHHPNPQYKGAAHQVSVPFALGVGLLSPSHLLTLPPGPSTEGLSGSEPPPHNPEASLMQGAQKAEDTLAPSKKELLQPQPLWRELGFLSSGLPPRSWVKRSP